MPIGTMPGLTAPLVPLLSVTLTQLDQIVSGANLLPPVHATPTIPLQCSDVSMGDEPVEPTVAVSFSVSHHTFDPPEGSLTWLAACTNPSDGGQPQLPISFCHLVNEFLCPMSIQIGNVSGGRTFQAAQLNVSRGSYLAGVHRKSVVDPVRAAVKAGSASAVLRLGAQVLSIFPHLVALLFRRSLDRYNLSNPGNALAQTILGTFQLGRPQGAETPDALITVDLQRSVVTVPFDIPCHVEVEEEDGEVEFKLAIQFDLLHVQQRAHLLSVLVGADLSRLAISGLGNGPLSICEQNCENCFSDYFPIARGGIFLQGILTSCTMVALSATHARQVVLAAQEAIRLQITTANNWTETCEDEAHQPFQWALARVLGKIKEDHPRASPMLFLRHLKEDSLVCSDSVLKARLILQAGIGHCREFSEVSFCVLTQLAMAMPGTAALLGPMVRAEYGDQDHAFVVGGVPIRALSAYRPEDAGEEDDEEGGEDADDLPAAQWDVAADLLASGAEGWVCDPYLEAAKHRETLKGKHAAYLADHLDEEEDDFGPQDPQDDVVVQLPADDDLLRDSPTTLMLLREKYPDAL